MTAKSLLQRLRDEINRELPRTHKGFRAQYEQDMVMRALDAAFVRVTADETPAAKCSLRFCFQCGIDISHPALDLEAHLKADIPSDTTAEAPSVTLCTCLVLSGGIRGLNRKCPIHGAEPTDTRKAVCPVCDEGMDHLNPSDCPDHK